MTPLRLSPRHAAVRMPTPQGWQYLQEDLESAAQCNRAQEEELDAVRADLAHARQQLAHEQELRAHSDELIGTLFRQREDHAGHARYAYEQLARAAAANRQALDIIRDLRAQIHGQNPRPDPAAAAAVAVRTH